jgi:hypothetical protein
MLGYCCGPGALGSFASANGIPTLVRYGGALLARLVPVGAREGVGPGSDVAAVFGLSAVGFPSGTWLGRCALSSESSARPFGQEQARQPVWAADLEF